MKTIIALLIILTTIAACSSEPTCEQRLTGVGSCEMLIVGIEFDPEQGNCVEAKVGGCSVKGPGFESLEECQRLCE